MKYIVLSIMFFSAAAFAQQSGRDDFMARQAYDETQRISGLVGILQTNISDVERRIAKVESSSSDGRIRAEIDALKASMESLRREMAEMRKEIVKDLSSRIAAMSAVSASSPRKDPPSSRKPAYSGECEEYTVQSGDSLYMISLAFNTTVGQIKEMNNLKNNNLRIGQKLLVPKNSKK